MGLQLITKKSKEKVEEQLKLKDLHCSNIARSVCGPNMELPVSNWLESVPDDVHMVGVPCGVLYCRCFPCGTVQFKACGSPDTRCTARVLSRWPGRH